MNEHSIKMFDMKRAMRPFVGILYSLARHSKTGNILEIGVRQGQSTRTILGALADRGDGQLTSIDIRSRADRIPQSLSPYWYQIVGNSHDGNVIRQANDTAPYDFILIDGDHTMEGVSKDFFDYCTMVSSGGLILLHDVMNDERGTGGVKKFWDNYVDKTNGVGSVTVGTWPGLGIVQV